VNPAGLDPIVMCSRLTMAAPVSARAGKVAHASKDVTSASRSMDDVAGKKFGPDPSIRASLDKSSGAQSLNGRAV
jgi:hypothetical protein